jgi:hypothetical protein
MAGVVPGPDLTLAQDADRGSALPHSDSVGTGGAMFSVSTKAARAELRTQNELDRIVQHLRVALPQIGVPLLQAVDSTVGEVLGVPLGVQRLLQVFSGGPRYRSYPDEAEPQGEVFVTPERITVVRPGGTKLYVTQVTKPAVLEDIDSVCDAVALAAQVQLDGRRLRGMTFDWQAVDTYDSMPRRARMIRPRLRLSPELKTQPVVWDQRDRECARLIAVPSYRAFLLKLAQVSKVRQVDVRADSDFDTTPLLDAGLVTREYLVVCRQDSHTICNTPDLVFLSQGSQPIKCPVCQRALTDELHQEILALTDDGKRLIKASHWMTIWTTELLLECGVPEGDIWWNCAAGEDEVDIVVSVLGTSTFFELKDREFGLGDAYPFAFRLSRYGAYCGVVVSTQAVGTEALKFLGEQRLPGCLPIQVLTGDSPLQEQIAATLVAISREAASGLLTETFDGLALGLLLEAWREVPATTGMA